MRGDLDNLIFAPKAREGQVNIDLDYSIRLLMKRLYQPWSEILKMPTLVRETLAYQEYALMIEEQEENSKK